MKEYRGRILRGDQWLASRYICFIHTKMVLCIHWLVSRAILNVVEKKKQFLPLPEIEPWSPNL
jgi:hypothetical protein